MKEKFLPIGSVVKLKNATKRLMITGYYVYDDTNTKYDYIGCIFPEGFISNDKNLLFNKEQIDKLYYIGYKDKESETFYSKLEEIEN